MRPLAEVADSLTAVSIPGEAATLRADETAAAARSVGFAALTAASVAQALGDIASAQPGARILICGSLYLAGHVIRLND